MSGAGSIVVVTHPSPTYIVRNMLHEPNIAPVYLRLLVLNVLRSSLVSEEHSINMAYMPVAASVLK